MTLLKRDYSFKFPFVFALLPTALMISCRDVQAVEPPRPQAPAALTVAPDGAMILADLHRPGLFRRALDGHVEVFAAGSPRLRTPLHAVMALACDPDGTVIYAADRASAEVYRVRAGKPPEPMTGGAFEIPTGLIVDSRGDLLATDLRLGTVSRIPRGGGAPVLLARVPAPRGLARGKSGEVAVLSMGPDQLVVVGENGAVRTLVEGKPFQFPIAVLRDPKLGRYWISDGDAATIWDVTESGEVHAWLRGKPLVRPEGLALDSEGRLLVADPGAAQVFRFSAADRVERLLSEP